MNHATRSPLVAKCWRRALAALTVAALGMSAVGASSASAETTWLCRPGLTSNPCLNSEETTVEFDGGASFVEHPRSPAGRRSTASTCTRR